jgi:type IV secretion system protein VirD4
VINRTDPQIGRRHATVGLGRHHLPLLILAWAAVALVVWHLALVVTGGPPLTGLGYTVRALVLADPIGELPSRYRPGSALLTVLVAVLLFAGGIAGWVWLRGRWERRRSGIGLADKRQARRSAGEIRARRLAKYVRRASIEAGLLDVDTAPLAEVGQLLGTAHHTREQVVLTLEDQVGIIAATGAGKTLYLMVSASLDAPGPLIATSTKPEVLDAIVETRTGKGRVWVFDPLNVANWPEPMVWDPIAGATDATAAVARGEAFAAALGADRGTDASNPFFQSAAAIIMARLIHAAALSDSTMVDVAGWALELERSTTARDILSDHPGAELFWAQTLRAASEGADETLSSVRMTLGQKVEPILSRTVMRQMLPAPGVPVFDPAAFVTSTDTLVLITDDQARTNVAPLTTMLLNEVLDAAKAQAARSHTGRLDPPLRIVGDEIANVAPVPKLPGNLSDSRGVGIQWFAAFQSVAQILARWGEDNGRQILANLNCSIILGGLQDEKALERFSTLVGKADLVEVSSQLDTANTATTHSVSLTEREVLRPEEIRLIPDGQALVIYRNSPAMIVDLIPWTKRPDSAEITAGIKRVRAVRIGQRT